MYEFTEKMGEISGMGGGYEQTCRDMLKAGLEWLDNNPNADPKFHVYENIYGIINEDNEDAEKLSKAVMENKDCTGAMHQAVITAILWIKKNGWDAYAGIMLKKEMA